MDEITVNLLAGIVRNGTPLVIVALGEVITERAGVVNLSLNGSIILAALVGFIAACETNNLVLGVSFAMFVGAAVAFVIAIADIELAQDQMAVGFILALLCADLAQFLGTNYTHVSGPVISDSSVPFLVNIPIVGPIFFNHNWIVYLSYVLVGCTWFWLFFTRPGLSHRAVGENPEAAFLRGTLVNCHRYVYTTIGGALVGLAGVSYSLSLKPGWVTPPTMDGNGWIALAIVIFGGWHPLRIMLGAYLFAALRLLSSIIQHSEVEIAVALIGTLPWIIMITTLAAVQSRYLERVALGLPKPLKSQMRIILNSTPPKALGKRFDQEKL